MNGGDLSPQVCNLLRVAAPTMDAVELLVFLARHPDDQWTADDIVSAIRPVVVTAAVVEDTLARFRSQGLIREVQSSRFRFEPASAALRDAVADLVTAYNERPVSLIRTVYEVAAARGPESFAKAFKITRDEP